MRLEPLFGGARAFWGLGLAHNVPGSHRQKDLAFVDVNSNLCVYLDVPTAACGGT